MVEMVFQEALRNRTLVKMRQEPSCLTSRERASHVLVLQINIHHKYKVSSIIFLSTYFKKRNLILPLAVNETKISLLFRDFVALHSKGM